MLKIQIAHPAPAEAERLGTASWDTWSCGVSTFDWHYDEEETCYILEGRVTVETAEEKAEIGPGDLVTFPAGLDCTWRVHEPIRKSIVSHRKTEAWSPSSNISRIISFPSSSFRAQTM